MKSEQKSCVHYWLIEEADGGKSKGKCKFCGAKKEFHNNLFNQEDYRFAQLPIMGASLASEAVKIGRHGFRKVS